MTRYFITFKRPLAIKDLNLLKQTSTDLLTQWKQRTLYKVFRILAMNCLKIERIILKYIAEMGERYKSQLHLFLKYSENCKKLILSYLVKLDPWSGPIESGLSCKNESFEEILSKTSKAILSSMNSLVQFVLLYWQFRHWHPFQTYCLLKRNDLWNWVRKLLSCLGQ